MPSRTFTTTWRKNAAHDGATHDVPPVSTQAWGDWLGDLQHALDVDVQGENPTFAQWAVTTVTDRALRESEAWRLNAYDVLAAFGHPEATQVPTYLRAHWDGTALYVTYQCDTDTELEHGEFRPLSEDQLDLAVEFANGGPEASVAATHRAVAVPAPLAAVAAALVRGRHQNGGRPVGADQLLAPIAALHAQLPDTAWATVRHLVGRSWPGTAEQLAAATQALLAPAAVHA